MEFLVEQVGCVGKTKNALIRVTNAFMQMKKFDIAKLQEAYDG